MSTDTNFYGIISGKQSSIFSGALNKSLKNSMVVSVWKDIPEFQTYVGSNAKEEIKGLKAILITDFAFDEKSDTKTKAFAFTFMQSMFKEKELYGIHIILYSQNQLLVDELNTMYEQDSSQKYEGTRVLYNSGDTTVTNIAKVFEQPFSLLSYSDKKKREIEQLEEEQEEKNKRLIANRGFMMLLGKQEALQEIINITNRELTVVNRKIFNYSLDINNDNLDNIVSDIEMDINDDVKEQYDKLR